MIVIGTAGIARNGDLERDAHEFEEVRGKGC